MRPERFDVFSMSDAAFANVLSSSSCRMRGLTDVESQQALKCILESFEPCLSERHYLRNVPSP